MDELPHNLAAEAGLIGAVMFDNNVFERVRNLLSAEDFFAGEHYHLWTWISELINDGSAVDGTILRERVLGNEIFQYVGGVDYLGQLR